MGWIYGNTVVGENALSNGSASSYQYDKIFSNYYLAQLTEQSDGVFLGRKILIDYDQDLKETLIRVQHITIQVEQKDENGNIVHNGAGNPVYENVTGYFYWNSDNEYNYTMKDLVSLSSIDKNTIVYEEQSDETIFLICDSTLTLDQETSPATFLSVADIESENNEENNIKQSLKIIQEIYNNSNYKTNYEKNATIDKELLENSALADSTIWQKVSINNTLKYIKIAELNAKNPKIELLIKPPNPNGICSIPYINADNEDNYKLVMSAQPGFRINPHPYFPVEPYRPGVYTYIAGNKHEIDTSDKYDPDKQYYRDEQAVEIYCNYEPGKFYLNNNLNGQPFNLDNTSGSADSSTQYYIYGSDEGAYYTEYDNINGELKNPEYKPEVAIYYNKDGLNKETRSHVDVKNSIQFLQDGYSNYSYNIGEIYYELADINEEDFPSIDKTNLYYSLNDDGRYCEVTDNHTFNPLATYYYKRTINSQPDVNQLSICLPSIGNMVCEGWDKIYGRDRITGEVVYDPVDNDIKKDLINGDIENTDPNSIVGLLNYLRRKTKEIRGFSDDSIASKVAAIANSLNLKITTDENQNLETYERLDKTDKSHIIQNQIANSNLAIESLVDKIGLQPLSDDCYVVVPNVTEESFVPDLYYIKNGNSYDFASAYDDKTTYYTCRAKNIELNKSNSSTKNTIQGQLDDSFAAAQCRIDDIKNLAEIIGFEYTEDPSLTKSGDYTNTIYTETTTIQSQINSNDTDISKLIALLGVSRNNNDIPTTITSSEQAADESYPTKDVKGHLEKLYKAEKNYYEYIVEIATRLRNIEAFLADGHFLFTAGRSAEQASFSSPSDKLPR